MSKVVSLKSLATPLKLQPNKTHDRMNLSDHELWLQHVDATKESVTIELNNWVSVGVASDTKYVTIYDGSDYHTSKSAYAVLYPSGTWRFYYDQRGFPRRAADSFAVLGFHRWFPFRIFGNSDSSYAEIAAIDEFGRPLGERVRYDAGILYDAKNREWIGAEPVLERNNNPEVRKQWLRDLRRFKDILRLQHKMGVFDRYDYITTGRFMKPGTPAWVKAMVEAIKTGIIPDDLKISMHYFATRSVYPTPVSYVVDSLCDVFSVHLREEYGVFK